jgi:Flp pilus assembly protein TadG
MTRPHPRRRPPWTEPPGRARARERGASTLEFVLLTPLLLAFIAASIQWTLYLFARHVAETAAQAGAATAQHEAAADPAHWQADAENTARQRIATLAPNLLTGLQITPITGPDGTVGITVHATVPQVLSGWFTPDIDVHAQGPIERFSPDIALAPATRAGP